MAAQNGKLRITLADIALLTKVQRPVVSMWRSRSKGTDTPFPDPAALENGQELFAAGHILEWLASTGRGNNPDAAEDISAFAFLEHFRPHSPRIFDGVTSLLTLRQLLGSPIGMMSTDELMDAADEADPDDTFLYTELEALGEDLCSLAIYADLLAEGTYSTEAAFENLMSNRFRAGIREQSDVALTDTAIELVAAAAVELSAETPEGRLFADTTEGGSDLLMGIVSAVQEAAPLTLVTRNDDGGASRLVRRRLRVHDVHRRDLRVDDSGQFDLEGPVVHVAQYPPPGDTEMPAEQILVAVENTALQMDDEQRAVIIAPAGVLVDAATTREVDELRSGLLRMGRVRAVIRLSRGLVKGRPRQAQALWVLGPAHEAVPAADRWTMVADLSSTELRPDVVSDLVSDLAASIGEISMIRAHSFRFARLVHTRSLLASRGALASAPAAAQTAAGGGDIVRIEKLTDSLNNNLPDPLPLEVESGAPAARNPLTTIGSAIAAGHLKYLPGNRIADTELNNDAGAPVTGLPELLDGAAGRHIDQLLLAANYPSARRTEPGDIVFCTGPRPAAVVDTEGTAVVVYPARVLRISETDPGGLLPAVVAADINAATGDDWKRWPLRTIPDGERTALAETLKDIETQRAQAQSRLNSLAELATLITDGVAGRGLRLTRSPAATDQDAPTEGTR